MIILNWKFADENLKGPWPLIDPRRAEAIENRGVIDLEPSREETPSIELREERKEAAETGRHERDASLLPETLSIFFSFKLRIRKLSSGFRSCSKLFFLRDLGAGEGWNELVCYDAPRSYFKSYTAPRDTLISKPPCLEDNKVNAIEVYIQNFHGW